MKITTAWMITMTAIAGFEAAKTTSSKDYTPALFERGHKHVDCIPGSYGLKNGNGYKGYCCKSNHDCWDTCKSGKCRGPSAPVLSAPKEIKISSDTCVMGSAGKSKADGYYGFCCISDLDCVQNCKKGRCHGPLAPSHVYTEELSKKPKKSSSTTSTTTTSTSTTTSSTTSTSSTSSTTTTSVSKSPVVSGTIPVACIPGLSGKRRANGYYGFCCTTNKDCRDKCHSGVCQGPLSPVMIESLQSGRRCLPGAAGKREGNGYNGYCCETSHDCLDTCLEGLCNGPSRSPSQTTSKPSLTVSTNVYCMTGFAGKNTKKGYNGFCCKSDADCFDSCIEGECNGPYVTIKSSFT